MKRFFVSLLATVIVGTMTVCTIPLESKVASLVVLPGRPAAVEASSTSSYLDNIDVLEAYAKLPILFIENQGQMDATVKYYSRQGSQTVYFTTDSMVFDLVRCEPVTSPDLTDGKTERLVFSLHFLGNAQDSVIGARGKDEATVNYFIGDDPDKWYSNVAMFHELAYEGLYPNIDLELHDNEGLIEYEFVVNPGASVADIWLSYEGVESLAIEDGELVVSTRFGEMKHSRPYIYQRIGDVVAEVGGGFRLIDSSIYGFKVGAYDASYPLVIDPFLYLDYSTFLGGSWSDSGYGIAVDSSGCAYVTGDTWSNDFPTEDAYQDAPGPGNWDAFVTKLSADGSSLQYSTYLGGGSVDDGWGIAVDSSGCAYVTGETWSADFPTENEYQADQGGQDAFVTKLDTTESGMASLIYSTYLGGSYDDAGNGIAADSSGCAYVTGHTLSDDFPTEKAYQPARPGGGDAFVTKLDTTKSSLASLIYSTFLGGSWNDIGHGIAVDSSGCAYVTGMTYSTDFPTQNPFQGSLKGGRDAFVTKLSAVGDSLEYSTYLGGGDSDDGYGIAVDSSGCAYVTGGTASNNFPTKDAYQGDRGVGMDTFVTKLIAVGDGLQYSTYLGGDGYDAGNGIAVDSSGCAYVTGDTWSTDFPTENAYQGSLKGNSDAFVTKLCYEEPQPMAVGGEVYPPNKLAIMLPWIVLAMVSIAGIAWLTLRRRRAQN